MRLHGGAAATGDNGLGVTAPGPAPCDRDFDAFRNDRCADQSATTVNSSPATNAGLS